MKIPSRKKDFRKKVFINLNYVGEISEGSKHAGKRKQQSHNVTEPTTRVVESSKLAATRLFTCRRIIHHLQVYCTRFVS